MDSDLIKLVNRLQDTFSNLGEYYIPKHFIFLVPDLRVFNRWGARYAPAGGCKYLDMRMEKVR
jgi:hypothetical protein